MSIDQHESQAGADSRFELSRSEFLGGSTAGAVALALGNNADAAQETDAQKLARMPGIEMPDKTEQVLQMLEITGSDKMDWKEKVHAMRDLGIQHVWSSEIQRAKDGRKLPPYTPIWSPQSGSFQANPANNSPVMTQFNSQARRGLGGKEQLESHVIEFMDEGDFASGYSFAYVLTDSGVKQPGNVAMISDKRQPKTSRARGMRIAMENLSDVSPEYAQFAGIDGIRSPYGAMKFAKHVKSAGDEEDKTMGPIYDKRDYPISQDFKAEFMIYSDEKKRGSRNGHYFGVVKDGLISELEEDDVLAVVTHIGSDHETAFERMPSLVTEYLKGAPARVALAKKSLANK